MVAIAITTRQLAILHCSYVVQCTHVPFNVNLNHFVNIAFIIDLQNILK